MGTRSSESTQRELSNEYQHDRVLMVFKNLCILVHQRKVALVLEGLTPMSSNFNFPHRYLMVNCCGGCWLKSSIRFSKFDSPFEVLSTIVR